jgi:hypothetical protein
MPPSRTLSLRISRALYDRLAAEAMEQRMTRSRLAVSLLALGLDLPPATGPPPDGGRVVVAVGALFDALEAPGVELELRRELALLLARTAERETGPAQVSAVRELLAVTKDAAGKADEAWQAFQVRLRTAVYTDDAGNVIGTGEEVGR